MLDLILHLDQKLERLCGQSPMITGVYGADQAAKRRRRSASERFVERRRHTGTLSGLLRPLSRVKEEQEDCDDIGDGHQHPKA